MEIIWKGCAPSNFHSGRRRLITNELGAQVYQQFKPEAIVIHIMCGSLEGTDAWFNDQASGVSAHYGVGKAGEIHQYVNELDTAFHCGTVDDPTWDMLTTPEKLGVNPNKFTIGIEHEGQPDDEWPDAQYQASAQLIDEISRRHGIILTRSTLVPHHWIRASKRCPGEKVDLDKLIAMALEVVPQ